MRNEMVSFCTLNLTTFMIMAGMAWMDATEITMLCSIAVFFDVLRVVDVKFAFI